MTLMHLSSHIFQMGTQVPTAGYIEKVMGKPTSYLKLNVFRQMREWFPY